MITVHPRKLVRVCIFFLREILPVDEWRDMAWQGTARHFVSIRMHRTRNMTRCIAKLEDIQTQPDLIRLYPLSHIQEVKIGLSTTYVRLCYN